MVWRNRVRRIEQGWSRFKTSAASLVLMPVAQSFESDWRTIVVIIVIIIGVLLGPYEILLVLQRMWWQRRRERIARGEDVRPKKLPWDEED